jgi:NADPH-dependent 2,4-dienoyl-CoA reductase/sulfur reductase-like enzyme
MHIAILGNGVAGVSAALRVRARRPDWKISLVSGESTHHWSRPALMYVFMGHMRYRDTKPFPDSFWAENRIDLVRGWVTRIDTAKRRLELHGSEPLAWDRLLIATGSKSNRFGWPGQDLAGVQGMYGLFDLHALYENTREARHAVIVGGGLIGIELAEMLHSRHIHVTFLVREPSYWSNILNEEESGMINRLIREQGIGLELETELGSIEGDGHGRCAAVVTGDGRRIECQLVGLTAGVSPNVAVAKDSGIETGRGVLVDAQLRTRSEGVWAAGDCAEIVADGERRNLIQQVWYTGKLQGEVAGDNIAGEERSYDPGVWYNSAKFLDLEYHTYGRVNMRVPGERNLFWEHPGHRHSARVVTAEDGTVIGLQSMGLRWRHPVAERWIREQRGVDFALEHLGELAFEPELHHRYEAEIASGLREQLA